MFKKSLALVALCAMTTAGSVFAQADALVEMLQRKGLLTTREANEVKEQMFRDVREQMPGTKLNVGSWLDELRIYGDVRVRYEQFWNRNVVVGNQTLDEQDRTRFRLRLRPGMTAKAGDWEAGFRLASGDSDGGDADAVSTNTTFSNWGSKKSINIDLAYLKYTPGFIKNGDFSVTAGKMENPFWETDMVYDGDLTPEGFAEQYKYRFNSDYGIFATAGQWVLSENNTGVLPRTNDATKGKDAYMIGWQVGHEWKIQPKKIELKQAVGFYGYTGIRDQTFGTAAAAPLFASAVRTDSRTGRNANDVLDPEFAILTVNQDLLVGYLGEKYPIHLQGEYMRNFGSLYNGDDAGYNDGFKVGFTLGEAKKKGGWQIGYWYEYLGFNAGPSWFSDSDFGNGGTGGMGHIVKAQYAMTDFITLGVAYWNVGPVADFWNNGALGALAGQNGINTERFQFDVVMKF